MVRNKRSEAEYKMESIAFGLADGIICFIGLIIGVAKATSNPTLVIISGIIGGIADALGNSIGFFISQSTERSVQIHEVKDHRINTRIHSKKEVWMSGVLSFLATIFVLIILLLPFLFLNINMAVIIAFLIGIILSFSLGIYVGKLSGENQYKIGLKFVILTIMGAIISYIIGEFLKHLLIENIIKTF